MEVVIKAPDCFFNIKSTILSPCDEVLSLYKPILIQKFSKEKSDQIWFYLFLNLLRMADNLLTSMIQYYEQEYSHVKFLFLAKFLIDFFL